MSESPETRTGPNGTMPRVSIIVTCYNLGAYLQEALDSVAAYPDRSHYEVILVDDGSTDPATIAMIDGLDPDACTLIRQRNMGLAAARNRAIERARGEYIIPLDADNRLLPAMIRSTIEQLDGDAGAEVVYGDLLRFEEQNLQVKPGPFNFGRLYRSNYIDACAGFRRTLWQRLGGYDEQMRLGFEDWDLWLRAAVAGARFIYVPELLFHYRVRKGSMLSNTNANKPMLVEYIFSKPELRFLKDLRKEHMELLEWRNKPPMTGRQHLDAAMVILKKRFLG